MTAKEHARAAFKALLNLDPFGIGGAISSLIGDYVPTSRERSLQEAVKNFSEKVTEIASRIKPDAINKEDFAELFGKFEALARKTNREDKLRAAANILANVLLPPGDPNRSPFDELDLLMHCADALSSGAIALLGASIQIADHARAPGIGAPRPPNRSAAAFRFTEIRQRISDLDPDLILGLSAELRSLNLLHITEAPIATPDFGHYSFRVTPLGFRFADRFIEGHM